MEEMDWDRLVNLFAEKVGASSHRRSYLQGYIDAYAGQNAISEEELAECKQAGEATFSA